MNKKGYIQYILLLVVALFVTYAILKVTYSQQEVIVVSINNKYFTDIQMGFKSMPLTELFFHKNPSGDYRLYIESESKIKGGEATYTFIQDKIGNGESIITNVHFPRYNDTWQIKFELKNQQYNLLQSKCYYVMFINEGSVRKLERAKIPC